MCLAPSSLDWTVYGSSRLADARNVRRKHGDGTFGQYRWQIELSWVYGLYYANG